MGVGDWFSGLCFNVVHRNNLVYNTCWEDPRLDRVALELGPTDTIAMITSAGCNALDYALQGPKRIHCIDVNPRQNALLEFKIAGIRKLAYDDFYKLFGNGRHPAANEIYRDTLRQELSRRAQKYWDKHIKFFSGNDPRPSFYFHGTSGMLAWVINKYIDRVAKVRPDVDRLLASKTLDEQRALYAEMHDRFWKGFLRWFLGKDLTLSFLGVPRPQRQQIDRTYDGGVRQFIQDRIEAVFTKIPLKDNYFWHVYLTGHYTPECSPEYLKPDNFAKLKGGLVDHVRPHTSTLLEFLTKHKGHISRFVLLDHMDWLSTHRQPVLAAQWQMLLEKAAPKTRILFRSGGLTVDFIDPIEVTVAGKTKKLGDLLRYNKPLADELHVKDRVHTYGSFYIADLEGAAAH